MKINYSIYVSIKIKGNVISANGENKFFHFFTFFFREYYFFSLKKLSYEIYKKNYGNS